MNEASNDCEYSAHGEYIVEVGYHVVGVVKYNIKGGVGKDNPC